MCGKGSFMKIFSVLLIGVLAVSFSLTGRSGDRLHAVSHRVVEVSQMNTASELLVYLFQILFILFIISPPLIVLLLFLIWRELKTSNKLR